MQNNKLQNRSNRVYNYLKALTKSALKYFFKPINPNAKRMK